AAVGDADVAYQVLGEDPPDLLVFNGLGNPVELAWQVADNSEFFTRMASLGRLILFDRRGTGMSDGVPRNALPTWEDLADDAGAVLDAVGSKRAIILAAAETGPMALLFAAMVQRMQAVHQRPDTCSNASMAPSGLLFTPLRSASSPSVARNVRPESAVASDRVVEESGTRDFRDGDSRHGRRRVHRVPHCSIASRARTARGGAGLARVGLRRRGR